MAKKINGKIYVSASELADYVFCPEHWRLKRIEKVKFLEPKKTEGQKEHRMWDINLKTLILINRLLRWGIIILTVAILLAYFLGKSSET